MNSLPFELNRADLERDPETSLSLLLQHICQTVSGEIVLESPKTMTAKKGTARNRRNKRRIHFIGFMNSVSDS